MTVEATPGQAPSDLAEKAHWDRFYQRKAKLVRKWTPASYLDFLLDDLLTREASRIRPKSILEVGCGDSVFLTYLGEKFGAERVCGLDYSEKGCQMARERLAASGLAGEIFRRDLFATSAAEVGQFDFIYSLGFAEHFSDLGQVIQKLAELLKPGGVLVTEVPNLFSLHGLVSKIYQPRILAKHRLVRFGHLKQAYRAAELTEIGGGHVGLISMGIVAWGVEPRWPRWDARVRRVVDYLYEKIDGGLRQRKVQTAFAPSAPYVYAAGRKPIGSP